MDLGRDNPLIDVINESIRAALVETHTALPGRIDSYDPITQTAVIAIELHREFENVLGLPEPVVIPPIENVPVLFPRAGGFSITFPVQVGDKCLVVFAERDISGWMQSGQELVPPTARKHDYSDAVAILGLSPATNPIIPAPSGSALQIRSDDGDISVEVSSTGVAIKAGAGASGATIDTTSGPFLVTSIGKINLSRGPNELLAVISAALAAIAALTVNMGTPLDNASITAINAQKALIDALRI